MTLYIKINGIAKITEVKMTAELHKVGAENIARQFAHNNSAIVRWGWNRKNLTAKVIPNLGTTN